MSTRHRMKNIEMLNICYKFLNRFINADNLVEKLTNMYTEKLDEVEKEKLNVLINGIKDLMDKNPNIEDEYKIKRKESIKNFIDKLDTIPKNDNNNDFLSSRIEDLKKDYDLDVDSHERWLCILKFITSNEYFNTSFENLSDYELFEFITQYIKASNPPRLNQEEFDRLVNIGIEKDKREGLWRLAFNYENDKLDLKKIVDYFIKVKDYYYITELISAIGDNLDIDYIIDNLNDKELIKEVLDKKDVISNYVSEEQFNILSNKL